jgi:dihydroflavonol-4-reductase
MATRVFLTGATGFVGSHLARVLQHRGCELRCLITPGNAAENLAGVPHERVEGRLEDEGVLGEALHGIDHVAHLAALVSFDKRDRERLFAINVEGTRRLVRLARERGVARFLHVSSVAAVGYSERPEILDETAPYNLGRLRIAYCDSKHEAERVVRDEIARGLDAVIVNPSSMFGPGDRRKAQGSLLEKAAYGRIPFCPPGGSNFADVRDVAQGCAAALEQGRTGERYILGGDNLTGRQLLIKIAGVLSRRPPRLALPGFVARGMAAAATALEWVRPLRPPLTAQILRLAPRYMWFSSRKAEEELGYAAYPVEIAIKSAFDWMFDLDLLDAKRVRALGRV